MKRRNLSYSFGASPTVSMRRSKFDLSHGLKTSMSVGKLYPVDCTEVLPGDTFRIKEAHVARLSTAYIRPVMDNVYMDMYYFFVPYRLVYDDWERVFGNPSPNAYVDNDLAEIPVTTTKQTVTSKSVADYLGLPVGDVPAGFSILPFRAFALIYDEWFRNENTVNPMYIHTGALNTQEALNSNVWSANNYTGMLPSVGKKKDYFTSCLPSPQKGESVGINVFGGASFAPVSSSNAVDEQWHFSANPSAMHFLTLDPSSTISSGLHQAVFGTNGERAVNLYLNPSQTSSGNTSIYPDNLWADLSYAQTSFDVNDMRMAFALQKMLEADARYGTRYREYILGHFGVSNPDMRMQIPEFLGGKRIPLALQEVAQQNTQTKDSEGYVESPLGTLGAYSHTVGKSKCTKSFTEHGLVIACACIRVFHTYQQGVDKWWTRKKREDFYDPKFANLGEQPVYTSEIYASGDKLNASVFGYNEAWADYRYKPSKVTGQMRTGVTDSFDVYHFADYYSNAPVLSQSFTDETSKFFDRTVASSSDDVDNFLVDFWFDFTAYRVMPTYSIPGLIDHH